MDLILKCIHGSHLYGTNTKDSDTDYKGIYKEPLSNIILGLSTESINMGTKDIYSHRKNTPEDIDYTCFELRRFIKDCINGEMHALDMLFAPRQYWVEHSYIWEELLKHRDKLISSNLFSFQGYIQKQIGKYGVKGSRVGEVKRVRDWVYSHSNNLHKRLKEVIETFEETELAKVVVEEDRVPYLQVLNKKYHLTITIKQLKESLDKWMDSYGSRSIQASINENVDFKAVSHAFRGLYQCTELLETGNIVFPLKKASYLLQIKQGLLPYKELETLFQEEYEHLKGLVSKLPEQADQSFWDNWVVDLYTNNYNKE